MQTALDRNLVKQGKIVEKIEKLKLELSILREKQVELENETVLKEFRSRKISLDEFLELVRENKKEEQKEKALAKKVNEETNTDWRNKNNEEIR